ncbi:hypothetical protein V8C86DRAFT_3144187 [Haematococcus lacustris]
MTAVGWLIGWLVLYSLILSPSVAAPLSLRGFVRGGGGCSCSCSGWACPGVTRQRHCAAPEWPNQPPHTAVVSHSTCAGRQPTASPSVSIPLPPSLAVAKAAAGRLCGWAAAWCSQSGVALL